jgi:hypothetical protein
VLLPSAAFGLRAPSRRRPCRLGVGGVLVAGEELDAARDHLVQRGALGLNWITCTACAANSARTLARSCAQRRPHSKAALLLSTCTPFNSMARSSDARVSGMRPCCQA